MEETRLSGNKRDFIFHNGTLIFLIIALLRIVFVFESLRSPAHGNVIDGIFHISGIIIGIAIITFFLLLAFSFSRAETKLTKTFALVLFILFSVSSVSTIVEVIIHGTDLLNMLKVISTRIWNPLCYLTLFLFYKKPIDHDKGSITPLYIICFTGSILHIVLGSGYIQLLPFLLLGAFSFSKERGSLKEANVWKEFLKVIVIILVAALIISCVFAPISSRGSDSSKSARCNYCHGTGRADGGKCPWCGGSGRTYDNHFNDLLALSFSPCHSQLCTEYKICK